MKYIIKFIKIFLKGLTGTMEEKEEFNGFDDTMWNNIEKYTKELCERANENMETPQFIKEMIEKTKNKCQLNERSVDK